MIPPACAVWENQRETEARSQVEEHDEGDTLLVASDGKGKRVEVKDFPAQGRYGKGVITWELPQRVNLAGLGMGKGNAIMTLHLLKVAPKMTRLEAASLQKGSAVRGEAVVDIKAGDAVLRLTEAWSVDRFVMVGNKEEKKSTKTAAKKPLVAKKKQVGLWATG